MNIGAVRGEYGQSKLCTCVKSSRKKYSIFLKPWAFCFPWPPLSCRAHLACTTETLTPPLVNTPRTGEWSCRAERQPTVCSQVISIMLAGEADRAALPRQAEPPRQCLPGLSSSGAPCRSLCPPKMTLGQRPSYPVPTLRTQLSSFPYLLSSRARESSLTIARATSASEDGATLTGDLRNRLKGQNLSCSVSELLSLGRA